MKDEYDTINDFLDGKLIGKECQQFQKKVCKDPLLCEKLILMKMLRIAFSEPEHMEFLSRVESAHQAFIAKNPPLCF